ncbi:MAG: hypothetical protein IIT56_09580, partial [Bacteroidales bacterium]|nr:hypothetical protein [Bacteroidales bacterium]
MKKRSLFIIPLTLISSTVFAQNEYDALRFSRSFQQGTARSTAMGGAFGALGGDVSCLATNPAGMSVYKRGEFTFTPQFINCNSTSTINGFEADDSKFSFKLANVGFVQSNYNAEKSGFKGWSWGIAFNRLMDFNGKRRVYGRNDNGSMLDAWKDRANGLTYDGLHSNGLQYNVGLGYDCFLLDDDGDIKNGYLSPHDKGWFGGQGGYGEYQKFVSKTKGGLNSWDFAVSGNFDDKVLFGASIGVETLRYKQTSTYSEDDVDDRVDYKYWDFQEKIQDVGTGVNLKAGVIFKPVNYLRFGAAIHTPSWYQVERKNYSEVIALYDDNLTYTNNNDEFIVVDNPKDTISSDNKFKYNLMTPFKAIASAAFIVPGKGLLSIDYEYVNYSMSQFSNEDYDSDVFEVQNEA